MVLLGTAFGAGATAYALFADRYLPYIDWGAHLGLISVLADGGSTGALAFFERSFAPSPYLLFYLLTALVGQIVPVDVAAKIVLVIAGGALTLSAASFADACGRSPRLGLIAPLALFNISMGWGFGSFILAIPALFFSLAGFERLMVQLEAVPGWPDLRASGPRLRMLWAAIALVALYLAHGFAFVCCGVILSVRAAARAISTRSLAAFRALVLAMVLPALTVLPAAVTLLKKPTVEVGTERNKELVELRPVKDHLASFWRDTLELGSPNHIKVGKLAGAIFAVWILYSLFRSRKEKEGARPSHAPEIAAGLLAAMYLFGPISVNWPSSIWLVYPRFGAIAALAMFMLPRCDLSGVLGTIIALFALVPVGWNAMLNSEHIQHFSAWAKPYDEVRKLIPRGARVFPLTVPSPGDNPLPHHAIGSLYAYLMVDGASYVPFLFDKPELPVHYRHDVQLRAPYWQTPWYFDPRTHGVDYDYLVLRGRDMIRRTEQAGLHTLVKSVGDWSVYKTKAPRTLEELSAPPPTRELDSAIALMFQKMPLAEMKKKSPAELGDWVHTLIFGTRDPPAGAAHWYVGQAGAGDGKDLVRLDFSAQPQSARALLGALAEGLDARKVPFRYETAANVLEVSRSSYSAAKAVALDALARTPNTLRNDVAPFTKRIAAGLGAADEPDRDGLPRIRAEHTFGTVIADAIAEAIVTLPDGAAVKDAITRAEQRLREYGLDPDRPWLKRGHRTDDL